jgi:hypothetical protein
MLARKHGPRPNACRGDVAVARLTAIALEPDKPRQAGLLRGELTGIDPAAFDPLSDDDRAPWEGADRA